MSILTIPNGGYMQSGGGYSDPYIDIADCAFYANFTVYGTYVHECKSIEKILKSGPSSDWLVNFSITNETDGFTFFGVYSEAGLVVDTIIVDNQKDITLKYIPGDAPPPFLLPTTSGTGTNLANLSKKEISSFSTPSYALASGTYPVGGPAFFANVYLFYSGNANKP